MWLGKLIRVKAYWNGIKLCHSHTHNNFAIQSFDLECLDLTGLPNNIMSSCSWPLSIGPVSVSATIYRQGRPRPRKDSEVRSEFRPWSADTGSQHQPGTRRIFSACVVRTLTACNDGAVTQHPGLPRQKPAITVYTEIRGYLDIDICFHDTTITDYTDWDISWNFRELSWMV